MQAISQQIATTITNETTRDSLQQRLGSVGARWAFYTAILWIVFGLESIIRPRQENYRDALWFVPFVPTTIVFWFVHALQDGRGFRRFERAAFVMLMTASGLAMLGNIGVLTDVRSLAVLGFPLAAVIWTLAMLLFGICTWRAGVLPRWAALVPILLEPGSLLTGLALSPIAPLLDRGAYSGAVEKGIAIALIGLAFNGISKRALP